MMHLKFFLVEEKGNPVQLHAQTKLWYPQNGGIWHLIDPPHNLQYAKVPAQTC